MNPFSSPPGDTSAAVFGQFTPIVSAVKRHLMSCTIRRRQSTAESRTLRRVQKANILNAKGCPNHRMQAHIWLQHQQVYSNLPTIYTNNFDFLEIIAQWSVTMVWYAVASDSQRPMKEYVSSNWYPHCRPYGTTIHISEVMITLATNHS